MIDTGDRRRRARPRGRDRARHPCHRARRPPLPLSYETLLADALRIAGALHARGLEPGDRVALVVPEVSDFVRALLRHQRRRAGARCRSARRRRRATCRPSRASRGTSSPRAARRRSSPRPASRRCSTSPICACASRVLPLDELRGGPALARPGAVPPDTPALLQFTSGSTARAQGRRADAREPRRPTSHAIIGPAGPRGRAGRCRRQLAAAVPRHGAHRDAAVVGVLGG